MKRLPRVEISSADEWRRWLARRHARSDGVWLVFRKGAAGLGRMTYREALEEALCFGWIDSIVKRESAEAYLRKFTPRTNTKNWSETNKTLAHALIRARRMRAPGLKAIGVSLGRCGERTAPRKPSLGLPPFVQRGLESRPKAAALFAQLAPGYRARYLGWILSAKQEATRTRRLVEALRLLEQGVKSLMK